MNLLKKIKLWFKNDWKVVEVLQGDWTENGKTWETAVYEIFYSPCRKKYKLKISGFRPKKHSMYSLAIKYLNKYESDTKVQ